MRNGVLRISFFSELILISVLLTPILIFLFKTDPAMLKKVAGDGEVWRAIEVTFFSAFVSTLLGVIIGVPAGYFLARKRGAVFRFIENLVVLPTLIPHAIVGIMILLLSTENNVVGSLLQKAGIYFVDHFVGIVAVVFFVSVSYIVSSAISGFTSFPVSIEETSYTLGIGSVKTFLHISLPLAFPSILRGAILSFARAMSETGALLIVATYPRTAQILILDRFETSGLKEAQAISFIVIFLSLTLFGLLFITGTGKKRI